ncbi:protein PET117 homolog, mitochondrial [Copidosoma floridanum]|uniref:protein PET117 homolog, mitochondrial n=1 Tax=Copidosoma floridanum TaxID=29053 RepID=UPI0006C9E314|nr:protein PET117 homolog, mitochondrial [Copidosoma floridanum]
MSLASKLTLAGCTVVSVTIIGYVHLKQQFDREQMHSGVVKDLERQRQKRIQNLYLLTQQEELAHHLKKDLMLDKNKLERVDLTT